MLKTDTSVGVIEGHQKTANNTDRIRKTMGPAAQVNTGKGCHLDTHMVGRAIKDLNIKQGGILLIENIGNPVCPAAFDLGEATKVAILSVEESEDQPIKYPNMFAVADLLILSKIDLLPNMDFKVDQAIKATLQVNPDLQVLKLSARTGEGLHVLKSWILAQQKSVTEAQPHSRNNERCHG